MRRAVPWIILLVACSGGSEDAPTAPATDTPPAEKAAPAAPAEKAELEIEHLVVGSGESPGPTDQVKVHYHGTFPDGRVFDSSVQRGQPAVFPLNRVIPCWTQGLQEIRVGGKARLTCPPAVAYGARGAPPRIPPNATLHFEVELLEIQ